MFAVELTDTAGGGLGYLEASAIQVNRSLCGGLACSFELLTTDPVAPQVQTGDRAVKVWDEELLLFNGKIRDPLQRKAGRLVVAASSPFMLLDRRQLQADTAFASTDQGTIIQTLLNAQNARSPIRMRLQSFAASTSRDRNYDAGKQVREIIEQLSGVTSGPWFVETPVDEGPVYTKLELRYPPPPTPVVLTATLVLYSTTITVPSTAALVVGMTAKGIGLPGERRVIKILSSTQVQLSGAAYTTRSKNAVRTAGSNRADAITDVLDLSVGMDVSGTGIPAATTIATITYDPQTVEGYASSGWITLSKNATANSSSILSFSCSTTQPVTFTPGPAEAGVDRPDIRFEYGQGTLANLIDYEISDGLPVNGVTVSGIAPTTPARAEDSASIAEYDLHERWISLSDVTQQDTLVGRAYEVMKPVPVRTFSIDVARAGPGMNAPPVPRIARDFAVGDVVYLTIHDDATRFDAVPCLVSETTLAPSDDDTGVDQKIVLGELQTDDGS